MSNLHIAAPAIVSADNLGYADLPGKSSFLAYHLFGVDQASSIFNRVNPLVPLTVIGAPIYDADAAQVTDLDGFSTSFTTPARDRTAFVVFTDPYYTNSGVTAVLPVAAAAKASSAASRSILSWNNQAQYLQPVGSQNFFRASVGSEVQVLSRTFNQPLDQDIYYPDGTIQRGGFRMAALTSNAVEATMHLQHGSVLSESTPVAQAGAVPADSVTHVGGKISGDGSVHFRMHVAAFAIASALDEATALAAAEFIAAEVEARGINFWSHSQDRAI